MLLLSCKADADSGCKKGIAFPETFEKGTKQAYAPGDVQLATGLWQLQDALTGKSDQDAKTGTAALRIKGGGSASMLFDIDADVNAVNFRYATFGQDRRAALSLWYSTDSGAHWRQTGPQLRPSSPVMAKASFPIRIKGPVRFRIHNDGLQRANVDDFDVLAVDGRSIEGRVSRNSRAPSRDDNMALGNPSDATTRVNNDNNYLLIHPQYALSYNNEKGIANWVSWHLSMAWRGTAGRFNCFFSDASLPTGFFRASASDYSGSGFDRGHLCPSDDRTASPDDNSGTFLMTNMAPQSPMLNQGAWQDLEVYARSLCNQGNELYIIAGGYGQGGIGKKGSKTHTLPGGHICVPAHFWKIIIVLPVGERDLERISAQTRVIAVDMANEPPENHRAWGYYRTSVKSIEQATGFHFFQKLPAALAAGLKTKVDQVSLD